MKYFLIYFPDGSFQTATNKADPDDYMEGSRIYEVSGKLTIADISEVFSINGFELDYFPAHLENLLKPIYQETE